MEQPITTIQKLTAASNDQQLFASFTKRTTPGNLFDKTDPSKQVLAIASYKLKQKK